MTRTKEGAERPVTARGLTENVTGVYRLPTTIKEAIEREANADAAAGKTSSTPAGFVRLCVARELKRRGYELEPETLIACHLT